MSTRCMILSQSSISPGAYSDYYAMGTITPGSVIRRNPVLALALILTQYPDRSFAVDQKTMSQSSISPGAYSDLSISTVLIPLYSGRNPVLALALILTQRTRHCQPHPKNQCRNPVLALALILTQIAKLMGPLAVNVAIQY